jgi:copper chaperone CopZ
MGIQPDQLHESQQERIHEQIGSVRQATFAIEGMTCASCSMRVEKGLKKVSGVLDAQVNLATERGTVTYHPQQTGVEQVIQKRSPLMSIVASITQALFTAFSMLWEILWPLILGFTLSGIVQAVVSHQAIAKVLGGNSPKQLTFATLFGIASSSCSYAAVALARSIFQKGASFTASMAFELASTNLVIELGIILVVLMGWQFTAAEFVGGILMVIFIALIFRLTLTPRLVQMAQAQAEKGMMGRMEGHAAMDMSVAGGSFFSKLFSRKGFTSVSQYFVMDWSMPPRSRIFA